MKKGYLINIIIIVLTFAVVVALIPMMPEEVPMHFNIKGEVDRMGSRYEMLIMPALSAVFSGIMLILARVVKNESEKKLMLTMGALMALMFGAMGVYFAAQAISYEAGAASADGVFSIISAGVGVMIAAASNLMPKVKKNNMIGLRVCWSMKNDETWRKSQRFGGISGVICGAAMVISALFLKGIGALIAMLALLLVWIALGLYMAYRYAKE